VFVCLFVSESMSACDSRTDGPTDGHAAVVKSRSSAAERDKNEYQLRACIRLLCVGSIDKTGSEPTPGGLQSG